MFETIKIYLNEDVDIEKLLAGLVEYGYRAAKRVSEEGDFAPLGDTLAIYPLTFEYPLRIEFLQNRVERIRSCARMSTRSASDASRRSCVRRRDRSMIRPRRLVMLSRIRPTPDMRMTGPMESCNVGMRSASGMGLRVTSN